MRITAAIASVRKRNIVIPGLLLLTLLALISLFRLPAMADLSEINGGSKEIVTSSWQRGEVIAVLRHLERCDRVDAPCLRGPEGVTARAQKVASALAVDFSMLGLGKADIYHSPAQRTAETSELLFVGSGEARDWLLDCKEEDALYNRALKEKKPGRNLILVTHSSCIEEFEESLGHSSDTPDYAATLFLVNSDSTKNSDLLGFVDANDWQVVFGW